MNARQHLPINLTTRRQGWRKLRPNFERVAPCPSTLTNSSPSRAPPAAAGSRPSRPMRPKRTCAKTPEWALLDDAHRIERTFRFKNFAEAFAFVQRAADLAEAEGHHPDITFGWGYATVSLHTHKIKGLHENDFIMAAKLDRAVAA